MFTLLIISLIVEDCGVQQVVQNTVENQIEAIAIQSLFGKTSASKIRLELSTIRLTGSYSYACVYLSISRISMKI